MEVCFAFQNNIVSLQQLASRQQCAVDLTDHSLFVSPFNQKYYADSYQS
jgi:hypothetical protein